jgi:hypothetical protein
VDSRVQMRMVRSPLHELTALPTGEPSGANAKHPMVNACACGMVMLHSPVSAFHICAPGPFPAPPVSSAQED